MAVRKYFIVLVAMLTSLSATAYADLLLASKADIKSPFGCKEVDTSLNLVATYSSPYTDELCGKNYTVTCLGDGSDSSSTCKSDIDNVTVTMVGGCVTGCSANIQLSADAYNFIVGEIHSENIYITFVPA